MPVKKRNRGDSMFQQYRGLKKEIYILFYGRVVTSMGSMIWPMMTLILSNKMNMEASDIATLLLIMGLAQLPFTLFGGTLADRLNKKYNIIICDLITVISYGICAFIPLSMNVIVLFFIASAFAALEHPSYQALLADLSDFNEREKVYSLSYLGMNLGLVIAPTIGGLLFENYLNIAFLFTSLATFSSTLLILFFVKDIKKQGEQEENIYERETTDRSSFQVLKQNPCILLFILIMAASTLVYSQFNFLMPLNMEMSFGVAGAKYFGMMTSVNALVVIVTTPIFTGLLARLQDTEKMRLGFTLQVCGLGMFIFIQGILWLHFVAMIIFSFGEVINTIGMAPYVSCRVPAGYRGRLHAIELVSRNGFQTISQLGVAYLVEHFMVVQVWEAVVAFGLIVIAGESLLIRMDKKYYPLLQKT